MIITFSVGNVSKTVARKSIFGDKNHMFHLKNHYDLKKQVDFDHKSIIYINV